MAKLGYSVIALVAAVGLSHASDRGALEIAIAPGATRPISRQDRIPYPPSLKRKCVQGVVDFEFTVAEDGSIAAVTITKTPHQELGDAVAGHIREHWRYTPYDAGAPKKLRRFRSFVKFGPWPCR